MGDSGTTTALPRRSGLEAAVQTIRILVVFVVAAAMWEAARAVNAGLMSAGLITARAFADGMADLFSAGAPLQQRFAAVWSAHKDLVCSIVMLPAVVALSARLLVTGTVLDYLYVSSPAASERGAGGLLASGALMLLQAVGVYAMASWAGSGGYDLVPAGFAVICIGCMILAAGVALSARGEERTRLRRVKYLCPTSAAALLAGAAWKVGGPAASCATAASALGLCVTDAFIHARAPRAGNEETACAL